MALAQIHQGADKMRTKSDESLADHNRWLNKIRREEERRIKAARKKFLSALKERWIGLTVRTTHTDELCKVIDVELLTDAKRAKRSIRSADFYQNFYLLKVRSLTPSNELASQTRKLLPRFVVESC